MWSSNFFVCVVSFLDIPNSPAFDWNKIIIIIIII